MFNKLHSLLFRNTLAEDNASLNVYENTIRDKLVISQKHSFSDFDLYIETKNGDTYMRSMDRTERLDLDAIQYVEVINSPSLKYRYGESKSPNKKQTLIFTNEQYEELVDRNMFESLSGLVDVSSENEDGVVEVYYTPLSKVVSCNDISFTISGQYQTVYIHEIDPTVEQTYDFTKLDPISSIEAHIPPLPSGCVKFGHTKKEFGASNESRVISVDAKEILPGMHIYGPDDIENPIRSYDVVVSTTKYEQLEGSVKVDANDPESGSVSFGRGELTKSGKIVFSTSEPVGSISVRGDVPASVSNQIYISPITDPQTVGVDPDSVHDENIYLIEGVPIDADVSIHYGQMNIIDNSLTRTTVSEGEVKPIAVDLEYYSPTLKLEGGESDKTVIVGEEEYNIGKDDTIYHPVDEDVDSVDLIIVENDGRSEKYTVEIPDTPQLIRLKIGSNSVDLIYCK